jgi:hypothetical protein
MDSFNIFKRFDELKIIPVITIERVEYTLDLADALIEASLPCAEITLRTDDAYTAINKIAGFRKEVLLGAGTCAEVDQVKKACDWAQVILLHQVSARRLLNTVLITILLLYPVHVRQQILVWRLIMTLPLSNIFLPGVSAGQALSGNERPVSNDEVYTHRRDKQK